MLNSVTSCHRCPGRVSRRQSHFLAPPPAPPPAAAVCCGCESVWQRDSPGGRSGAGSLGNPGEGRSSRVTSPPGQRSAGTGSRPHPRTDALPPHPAAGERGGRHVAPPTALRDQRSR